jgi:hypothetical protein
MKLIVAAAASLAIMTATASAECIQSDLAGVWRIFVNSNDPGAGNTTNWVRCTFRILADGSVRTTSFCIDPDGTRTNVRANSNITLRTNCSASGFIRLEGGTTQRIVDSQLSRDGLTFAGVARDSDGLSTFVGVKR